MTSHFSRQLAKLPVLVILAIAVAGMPTDVYAYNQRELGHAHALPWLARGTSGESLIAAGCSLIHRLSACLCSPGTWQIAVPATITILAATGQLQLPDEASVLLAGTTIAELLEKKKGLVGEARAIQDRVHRDQEGEWRGDDEQKFDDLMGQAEKVTEQVDRMAKLDDAERSLQEAERNPGERRTDPRMHTRQRERTVGKPSNEDRALALHAWFAAGAIEGEDVITPQHRDAAQRCGVSLEQNKLRIRLSVHGPDRMVMDPRGRINEAELEKRLTQVDVVSPDLGGHYTVPEEMQRPLERAMLEFGGMRQVSTVIRTATGAELPTPTMNDTSNTGAILGEGIEHTELDTQFSQLLLHAYKYTSRRVPVSVEYLQDNAINFTAIIGSILGERIGRITNQHFTRGTGTAQPNGIVTAAADSTITTAGGTTITHDNIIDLKHSVDPAYRSQGARFMFNDTTLKILKKIKIPQFSGDTSGQPLWRAGLAAAEPDTIDGDPYTINQQLESGTGKKAMLYGLLSKYLIRDVRDITLVRLDERYAELGVVAFLAFSRHDGDLVDAGTNPVKYMTMG
jgi:HK97 family phage major capsid protein